MEHGTFGGYDHAGCRCRECRAWMADFRQYQRSGRPAVTTYEGGRPHERRAVIRQVRRGYQITQQGREYLTALRAEGASVAP